MSVQETHAKIQSQIRQEIERSDLDLSGLSQQTLADLINLASEAALVALDNEMETGLQEGDARVMNTAVAKDLLDDDKEDILWEGRPFLSISLHYTVTDERIRVTSGVLGKARENIELVRIQDIDYKQTMTERMINIGDISILSHDRSDPRIVLKNVKDPEEVYEILRRAVLNARKKHGFSYREEM